MKVVVDAALCEGNARCEAVAPEAFRVRDDLAEVRGESAGEELRAKIESAARLCPRQAISIVED
ncbi:MAG: ferredoxin [Candidatus Binatia bacterium]